MLRKLSQIYSLSRLKFKKLGDFIEENASRLLLVLILIYTLIFSGYTIFMHSAFKTYAWDLGIFTQALWTTINTDKMFYYTVELVVNPSGNYFGTHFSPVLFLIIPFYALFQSPLTLLVIQSFILGAGAFPLYLIANKELNDKVSALGLAAAYLLYPALHSVNCFDFHTECFIPLFFFFSFYYFNVKEWRKGFIFTFLLLSTIEFAPLLVMFQAFYLILKTLLGRKNVGKRKLIKELLFEISLILIAFVWLILAFFVMSSINPLKKTGLPGNWTYWGSTLTEVLINIISNPMKALTFMITPIEKVYYVISLLAPLLMLPLFSPEFICALPWLIAALLSEYRFYYHFYFQYSAFAFGQLFVAAIFSIKRLFGFMSREDGKKLIRRIVALLVIINMFFCIAVSPLGLPRFSTRKVEITPHVKILHEVLKLIPPDASIATQNDIFPHVAQREHAYILTWPLPMEVDYILVDLKSCHFLTFGGFAPALSPSEALEKILDKGTYGLLANADGILLFKRKYYGSPEIFIPRIDVFNYDDLITVFRNSMIVNDETSHSGKIIVHEPDNLPGTMWYGPYSYFYSGWYNATFRIKINSENASIIIDVADAGNVISRKRLTYDDFKTLGEWKEFTIGFKVEGLMLLEFRGFCESNNTYVALDYIRVIQLERIEAP